MTTTDVRPPVPVATPPDDSVGRTPLHRRRWVLVAAAGVAVAVLLGFLVGNEIQANTQTDQAHRSVVATRSRTAAVDAELAAVRRQLSALQGQVTQDSATLAADSSKLDQVKAALAASQANDSRQNAVIGDLHTCLGGVEEALNALSVGDQPHALSALNGVASSCDSVVAAGG